MPVAVEAGALTLELIAGLDPRWLERLRALLRAGRAEYVASGYSQIIGPLVPAAVNARNLDLGRRVAARLLGVEPELWLVNEMAWSGGLAALYREAGARAVIMEWNNAWHAHPEWDPRWRWHWQRAQGPSPAGEGAGRSGSIPSTSRRCSACAPATSPATSSWRTGAGACPAPTRRRRGTRCSTAPTPRSSTSARAATATSTAAWPGSPDGEWDTFAAAAGWLAAEPGHGAGAAGRDAGRTAVGAVRATAAPGGGRPARRGEEAGEVQPEPLGGDRPRRPGAEHRLPRPRARAGAAGDIDDDDAVARPALPVVERPAHAPDGRSLGRGGAARGAAAAAAAGRRRALRAAARCPTATSNCAGRSRGCG